MFAGTLTVGGVVSTTLTMNEALPVLPAASVDVQVTVVWPSGNVLPEGGAHVVATAPSTRSVALAAKLTAAPDGPVASSVMFAGTDTAGGVVSTTVTPKAAEALLPCASEAVQVTVVRARGNVLPERGKQDGVTTPSTMSVADAT